MRVAIVNDLPLVTEALRRIVLSDATHEVVWTAQDGEQAVRQCRRDTPDVVLMDLIMPNVNGAEATRRIMQENPCAVLVVTAGVSANFALVCEAMGYGAYDAVCTPVLGNRSPAEAGAELLGKLAAVERVNRRLAGKNAGGSHVGNRPVDSDLQVSRRQAEPVDSRLPLVAIGTSTGGPPALGALLKGLAEDFPAGIVIVQHIGQEFVGSLVEWLQAQTRLTVRVAANGQMPEPRTVLVAGSDDHLVMGRDGRLTYRAQPVDCPYRPSVDELFYSLVRPLVPAGDRRAPDRHRPRRCPWAAQTASGRLAHGRAGQGLFRCLRHASGGSGDQRRCPDLASPPNCRAPAGTRTKPREEPMNATPAATVDALANDATTFPITVLLVDDQPIIGEAVRRMLQDEADVDFHFCQDPTQALAMANQVRPTVILQDLVMPVVDGLTLVKFFRANPATCETPMIVLSSKEEPIVKAEAFAVGANDYLVKLPDKVELVARIRYHSKGYINLLQRNEAYEAIARSRKHLAEQMEAGAKYLLSLLPVPVHEPVRIDWRYTPSADLGGDTFGYHALDEDRFAIYLLDVTGHGLDSALFSVTVMNVLRSRALPNTDFGDPGQVLVALNEKFPMELYGEKMFTIWYGVYHRAARTLTWSGGGHPDALFFRGAAVQSGPGHPTGVGRSDDGHDALD